MKLNLSTWKIPLLELAFLSRLGKTPATFYFSLYKRMAAVFQFDSFLVAKSLMAKSQTSSCSSSTVVEDDQIGLRRGSWTADEDSLLIRSISVHGEGRWNLLAIRSGIPDNIFVSYFSFDKLLYCC